MPLHLARLLLASAALLPFTAQAAGWNFMLKADKTETLAFFDMASVVRMGGKIGIVSILVTRPDQEQTGSITAVAHDESFDCTAKTVQIFAETTFGSKGETIRTTKLSGPATRVEPSSYGQVKLNMVCDRTFANGKPNRNYIPIDANLFEYRHFYVEQERARAKAQEAAAAGQPYPAAGAPIP